MKDRYILRVDRILASLTLNRSVCEDGIALVMTIPFNGRRP